jgi:hypothetical protein
LRIGQETLVTTSRFEDRCSWVEDGEIHDAIEIISGRRKAGRIVEQSGTTTTLTYGSLSKFRLWGFLKPDHFPMTVSVSVQPSNGDMAEVEVIGRDNLPRYTVDLPARGGEPSLYRRLFDERFVAVCANLQGVQRWGGSG